MSSGCSGLVNGGLNQGDWPSGEKHRELQNPVFVGPHFPLNGDFWSVFGGFWPFSGGTQVRFYEFTSLFKF